MSKFMRIAIFTITGVFVLAACSSGPLRTVNTGDELASYDFSEPNSFEEGAYTNATLRVVDGVYRMSLTSGDSEVWWGQWGDSESDTVIDVDITQVSEANENAYGIACRLRGAVGQPVPVDPELAAIAEGATPNAEATDEATATTAVDDTTVPDGDGYLFLIRGSGSYAILRARNRQLTALVNWTPSDLITQGPGHNQLRAVCMGDYLAMYINGEFAADTTDDSYTSGQVGLAASSSGRLGVVVEFDNLFVHQAQSE